MNGSLSPPLHSVRGLVGRIDVMMCGSHLFVLRQRT